MKKLFNSLLLPIAITASLLLLVSASFAADELITISRNDFISVMNQTPSAQIYTLIIDPGHGGEDGGAVSVTGGKESELNLQIGKKAELFAAFFGIKSKMTRDSEELNYSDKTVTIHDKKVYDTKQRVALINSMPNAILISIHQNKYSDGSVKGAQLFYRSSEDSLSFAEYINENLTQISSKIRAPRQIDDSIYIFKHIDCPAVMIECGFISNYDENSMLCSNEYQNKLAIAVIGGFLNYENQLYKETVGGTYESKNNILLH